jgi:hypothetical protein
MSQESTFSSEGSVMTVQQLYEQSIKPLPAAARLQLATLILQDIDPRAVVDYSEEWSDQDLQDFSRASWEYVNRVLEEEENAENR